MDLVSLHYFRELAKDLNMTRTASRLFISQQTLSNHIHRLEQYYDTPLFYRKPTLSLTCAGEFVLSFAQVVEKEDLNLRDILSDVERQERGALRVGASPVRGVQFLPQILPAFYKQYPQVSVRYEEGLSYQLEKRVLNGELDFAIAFSKSFHPDLLERELLQDPVYLCVPEALFRQYYTPEEITAIKSRSMDGAAVEDFTRLPFSLMETRLGRILQERFTRAGVQPHVLFTSPSSSQIMPLCAMGVTACFSTHMALLNHLDQMGDQINIFPMMEKGTPLTQPLSLLRHRQRYLTHFSKYFMELLFQTAARMKRVHISRAV